jgi:aminoacyl tRNA synthase complex-interacting multifunctional protein 1|tara:strand:+ start:960 stop:1802 length:843 start_codon:yes stop_codon:yes gene_type:complete
MDTMSAFASALMGDAKTSATPSDAAIGGRSAPPGVTKVKCEKTGYVLTKPFEANNPMPGAFDQTCDYIVAMLNPVIKPKGEGVKKPAASEGGEGKAGQKKEKKEKKPAAPVADIDPMEKAKLVVGRVVEVGHVENSDKLYLCKVDVGEEAPRQVVTGLRKFVPEGELKDAMVLTIINLKVAKLAGQTSEAMILATEFEADGEQKVKLVKVPETATCGAAVTPAGMSVPATFPKECKSKFWDAVKEKLVVKDGKAVYGDKVLACESGECTAPETPSGSSIK